MNAITPTTTSRLTLTAELSDNVTAEFMANQVTISTGAKNGTSILERDAWTEIVARSATFDAIMAGRPMPVFELPAADRPALIYPELGTEIGGGFCAGRHPEIDGAVLIISGHDGDFDGMPWGKSGEPEKAYRAGGHDDWRRLDRLESLTLFKLKDQMPGFRKGEKHALAEEAYWTNEEFDSGYAWGQSFAHGRSGYWRKSLVLRVRLGRIVLI